jgi:thiol:disulfide interchange protein
MSKKRRGKVQATKKRQVRPRRWPQVAIVGGMVLLVAVILVLKNQAAEEQAVLPEAVVQTRAATAPKPVVNQPTATALPNELPEAQLGRLLAAGQPVLGFYHSTNCAKCIEMMATVAEVYPEFKNSVGLVDVNVYDKANTKLLQVARIYAIPTQIFYDKSGQQKTVLGVMTAEELRAQLRALVAGQ